MTTTETAQATLTVWGRDQRETFPNHVQRCLNMMIYDLYYGPTEEGDCPDGDDFVYPGFIPALRLIRTAIDSLPHCDDVWIDCNDDWVMTKEPKSEKNPDFVQWDGNCICETDCDCKTEYCECDCDPPECDCEANHISDNGPEYFEPNWDNIHHFSRRDVLAAILGDKELVSYL